MSARECPHCSATLPAAPIAADGTVRCRTCGRRTRAPERASPEPAPIDQPVRGELPEVPAPVQPRADYFTDVKEHRRPGRWTAIAAVACAALVATVSIVVMSAEAPTTPHLYVGDLPPEANRSSRPARLPGTAASAPAADDPASSSRTPRTGAPKGLAAAATIRLFVRDEVFLNSELALADFEFARQAVPDGEQADWFHGRIGSAGGNAMIADWWLSRDWLAANRPTFSVGVAGVPRGTSVRIELAPRNDAARRLLDFEREFATDQEIVLLDTGTPGVWWHAPATEPDGSQRTGFWEIALRPRWRRAEAERVESPVDIEVEATVFFVDDGSMPGGTAKRVRVVPANTIELDYPGKLGIAGMVDEDHPYVQRILNDINQSAFARATGTVASGGGDPARNMLAVYLLWRELQDRQLRYSSLGTGSAAKSQVIRPVHESLAERNANCADGSVLLASFLQRMGLDATLVLTMHPDGHAFVQLPLTIGGAPVALETTLIMSSDPCSDTWLAAATSSPYEAVAEFIRTQDAAGVERFKAFLRALEAGTTRLAEQAAMLEHGFVMTDPAGRQIQVPPMKDLLESLESTSEGEQANALLHQMRQFMSAIPIGAARVAGIRPIGHDPAALARHPLPASASSP